MVYKKRRPKPPLTLHHKTERLRWAEEHMTWDDECLKVLFTDEKKFNLHGPDGMQYYWHDIRNEQQYYSTRVQGGGSVMIWGGFGFNGTTPLAFVTTRLNSGQYQDLLLECALPYGSDICGKNWIFQQDNGPCHSSKATKNWLKTKGANVMS